MTIGRVAGKPADDCAQMANRRKTEE